jgi:large subunit ribosomal protein L4e
MKTAIYTLTGKQNGEVDLPKQFSEKLRADLIKKMFLANQKEVDSGASSEAGKRYSAKLSRRRRDYKTGYGRSAARVPRKVLWRRGRQFGYVGALAPGTVGGRKAHPPKSEKSTDRGANRKEKHLAIRSALSCSVNPDLVKERNHLFSNVPLIVEDTLEELKTTKDVKKTLESLGLKEELIRIQEKKIRSGKGTLRGRKYQRKVGPLLIVSKKCSLQKAAKNFPGLDVSLVSKLDILKLAPGGVPGRLCVFTNSSIKVLSEGLFTGEKNGSA